MLVGILLYRSNNQPEPAKQIMLFPDALDGSAVKPRRGDTSVTLYEHSVV